MDSVKKGVSHSFKTPFIIWTLLIGTLINFIPSFFPLVAKLPINFLGWVIPLLGSVAYILFKPKVVKFPIWVWVPWCLWVIIYLLFSEAENSIQRTVMLLTPLIVGMAFSTVRVDGRILRLCERLMYGFLWVFVAGFLISIWRGDGSFSATGSAAKSITASLLATWFAVGYSLYRRKSDLLMWSVLALVPVLQVTRMGILAVGMTLPATLGPLGLARRAAILLSLAIAGVLIFQTERIQSKMFFSGQGTVKEAFQSGISMLTGEDEVVDNFRTNARDAMGRELRRRIDEAFWFGHGANAVEEVTRSEFGGLTHPHNDWLRLQHDYGTIGLVLFGTTLLLQTFHAWRVSRMLEGSGLQFMLTGTSAFIPMGLFMLTDNVILYVAWFGNLHFAMLGLGYAATRNCTGSNTKCPVKLKGLR